MEEKDDLKTNLIENKEDIQDSTNKVELQESENSYKNTLISQIDPTHQGEVRLMSLDEKLRLDVPGNVIFDEIDESMNFDILLYTIKDFIMMLILLLSSLLNFNYLYLPFLMAGLSYNCLILENKDNSRKTKFVLELIIFIYAFLLLIFKIVSLIFIFDNNEFFLEHKSLFIDLGISCLISKEEKIYFISTFLGESLVLLFSLGAIIIYKITNITDEQIENRYFKKLTYDSLFTIMRKYLFTCYFVMSGVAVFNKSILSFIYIIPMCLLLFLYAVDLKKTTIYNLFRTIVGILLILLILEILVINITNFYSIAQKYFLNSNNQKNNFLIIWSQLGFYFNYKENKLNLIPENLLGYSFSCLTTVTFSLCIKAVSKHELLIAKKKEDKNENDEKDEKRNIINIFFDNLGILFTNPYFILHICRLMAIYWLYIYRNFYSLGIFIWLFFSFLYLHIGSNEFWTIFVLIPSIFISLSSIHISRINGVYEDLDKTQQLKYFHIAIGKYDNDYLRYIFVICFYFFTTYFLHTLNEYNKKILKTPIPEFGKTYSINDDNNINDENQNKSRTSSLQDINISYIPENNNVNNNLNKGDYLNFDYYLENQIKYGGEIKIDNNIDIEEDEITNEKEKEKVTFKNIIMKNIFGNIDKITLISMYFVAFNTVNIIHLVFLFFFMIQLLFPEVIRVICVFIIMILQILYLIEYIMDLSKVYNYESFKNDIKKIQFFLVYDEKIDNTSIEIFIYLIVYCFYIQYQLYKYKLYEELVDNKKINLKNYVHKKFQNYPYLKKLLFFIGNIILNMYVWIIILLFIFFLCFFELNLIFGIKLGLFLISIFFLMLYIQDPKNKKISLKSSRIVLIYSGIDTLVVYLYQLLCHPFIPLKGSIENSNNYFVKNLPIIGLTKYDEKELYLKLLPHFFTNFLSLLYFWEMKRTIKDNEKELSKMYTKKLKTMKEQEENINENNEKSNEEKDENNQNQSPAEKYEKNRDEMTILDIKNIFFNIIMIITKFYWLFLFIIVCIFFTTKYLTFGMIIYLVIFGLTFIFTFLNIVRNLNNFIKKESYFISKVIRYSLIEVKSHIKQNYKFRKIGFQYLFGTNCIYLFLFYMSGIFYLFDNPEYWKDSDSPHSTFSSDNSNNKKKFISISYLFGFYVNLKERGIISTAWADLLLFCLIALDVYIEKIENYFTELALENRKKFKILKNENIKLKPLTLLGENNILANIEAKIISNNMDNKNALIRGSFKEVEVKNDNVNNIIEFEEENEFNISNMSKKYFKYLEKKYNDLFIGIENLFNNGKKAIQEKDKNIGKRYIIQFLEAFKKASISDVELSEVNNKYKIIKGFKQVFEEVIIFLLICTAISKLNIWSFIYMIFSLFLILTKKSVRKYYSLFCFIIVSIIFQNFIFVTNIRLETDPSKSEEILSYIRDTLGIPWFEKYMHDKNGFFLGLGVNRMQINLMWMDYIETIILYIYLDFFSYSIYQDVQSKGKIDKGVDKINYYNLHLNEKVRESVEVLSLKEFNKHQKCMKYDFNIDIGKYEEFKEKILLIKPKDDQIELKELKDEDIKNRYHTVNSPDVGLDIINENENEIKINIENQKEKKIDSKKIRPSIDDSLIKYYSKDNIDEESPLLLALADSKKMASKKNLITKSIEQKDDSICINAFKKTIYLSLHNIILIIIMIISMMVSGLLSIFYISFSLIFLMKSNSMYMGEPYLYPKSIKTVLRVAILIDIAIQTLYQTPYINPGEETNTLYIILKIIGFNKIIYFGENGKAEDFEIYPEQMILVLAKAFTYFFMSIQIMIYSSQDFQEYYLTYLLTKSINLRRISLMNVFRFNNERIETMGKSISLRQEMQNSMILLEKRLESWTKNLSNIGGKLRTYKSKKLLNKSKEKKLNELYQKEEVNPKENNIFNFINKVKSLSDIPEKLEEKENQNKIENIQKEEEITHEEKKGNQFFDIFGIKIDKSNEEEEEYEEEEYVPENIVKEKIKSWIFGGILIKIQLWLHKKVASYTSIEIDERDVYEKELIQGRTTISSMLETMVELQLNTIDLSNFTSDELHEVKKYFDGTRQKELIKLKKEKEKKMKLQKTGNQVITLNQLKKEISNNIESKKGELKEENEENEKGERNSSFYENMKSQEENLKNIIDITQPKFKELEKFTSNELFVKYLKTSYILSCIIADIIAFCSNQFHWLCYLMMIIDHIFTPSILSLFYPFSIFLYAILEYPRPKKTYWKICLVYTVILIAIKFVVQLQLFVKIFEDNNKRDVSGNLQNPYKDFIESIQHFKLGLIFFDSTFSLSFFSYIVYDALVIIFLLINNHLLVSKGIWIKTEQEIENIYQAMERIASTKHLPLQTIEETKAFNFKWLFGSMVSKKKNVGLFSKQYSTSCGNIEKEKNKNVLKDPFFFKKLTKLKYKNKKSSNIKEEKMKEAMKPVHLLEYDEKNRTYFQRLFPRIRNEKPGNDYYASYTITMLVIIFYIILFYTNMNQDKTFNSVSIDTNQFSSSMVIFLIIHVIFLVYDRIIYICQNRNNLDYDYIIYDKNTCSPVTEKEFNQIKSEISLKFHDIKREKFFIPLEYIEETKDKYNIIYIQTEEFNFPLLQKYILHLIITIFSHIFIFFYLPMKGNFNISNAIYCIENEECNDFLYNPYLIIFYLFYVVYLIGSGLQVKYGFYDLRRKSLLKSGNSSISGGIYAAYKAIPFLYEIKLAIDWTFTSTCLDLFQWNKFEGIYDTIYSTYCSMTAKNIQLVGQTVKKYMKIGMGGVLSFGLILLLVIPLMLFSSLNPTNELNNLTGATLDIDLSIFYKSGEIENYTLFENSKPLSIKSLFPGGDEDWKGYKYSDSIETKNFPKEQIQKIEFFKESDRNWGLAKPHILNLIKTLEDLVEFKNYEIDKIFIVMEYKFERNLPVEAKIASDRIDTIIYDESKIDESANITGIEKVKEFKEVLSKCDKKHYVTFNNFYSAPLRLTANLIPGIIADERVDFNFNVTLGFIGCLKEDNGETNYLESYFTLEKNKKIGKNEEGGLVFHAFSDKVSSSTSGYSVLTFYVSFILLAGTYVRNFFSGQAEKITLTELPNPEAIINLCEGVQVSRYSFDYEQEEKLYYILIELMRSPDYLKILTESSTEQFRKRRELTIKEKNNSALKFE